MTRIETHDGFPVLFEDKSRRRSSKPRRTTIDIAPGCRLPLYAEDGRTLGPTEALDALLSDGPITESDFNALAAQFADPNVLHRTAERLGAVRVRHDDGSVYAELPGVPSHSPSPSDNPSDKESQSMAFSDSHDGIPDSDLVPFREATRRGVTVGQIEVIRRGSARFVRRSELERAVGSVAPQGGGEGAGSRIAHALDSAQRQRASAHDAAVKARKESNARRRAALDSRRNNTGR